MEQANNKSIFITITKSVLFCAIVTGLLKLSLFITSSIPELGKNFLSSAIGPMLTLLVTYLFLKFDKKTFSSIGLKFERATIGKFCIGFLFGILTMTVLILSIVYASGLSIQPTKSGSILFVLFSALPIIILLAVMEELTFRGYPMITLKNGVGAMPALIITSVLFGLYHVVFGWGIQGFFSTSIWGLAFGLLAIYSKGISMPTGFHAAGNLVQSAFGSSFGIWEVVSINGQQPKDFPNSRATIIYLLILLIIIIFCIRLVFKRENVHYMQ